MLKYIFRRFIMDNKISSEVYGLKLTGKSDLENYVSIIYKSKYSDSVKDLLVSCLRGGKIFFMTPNKKYPKYNQYRPIATMRDSLEEVLQKEELYIDITGETELINLLLDKVDFFEFITSKDYYISG